MPNTKEHTTRDEYQIHGNYGQGWEEVSAYDTRPEARADLKLYRENEPQYAHKLVKKRIPLQEVSK